MGMPDCMTAEEIRIAMLNGKHIGILSELILCRWLLTKAEVQKYMQPYWSFTHEIAITGSITKQGRRIIIPAVLQHKALK